MPANSVLKRIIGHLSCNGYFDSIRSTHSRQTQAFPARANRTDAHACRLAVKLWSYFRADPKLVGSTDNAKAIENGCLIKEFAAWLVNVEHKRRSSSCVTFRARPTEHRISVGIGRCWYSIGIWPDCPVVSICRSCGSGRMRWIAWESRSAW